MERVALDDNFFDLGGHSLLLLRAHSGFAQTVRARSARRGAAASTRQFGRWRAISAAGSAERSRWQPPRIAHASSAKRFQAEKQHAGKTVAMSYAEAYDPEEGIAIVGMAGRFPGARNVDAVLAEPPGGPRDDLPLSPPTSWSRASADDMARAASPNYVRARGILDGRGDVRRGLLRHQPAGSRDHRSAAAASSSRRLGGAGARRLRPADVRRARSASSRAASNNYYYLAEPAQLGGT